MKASELRIGNYLEFYNGIQPKEIVRVNTRFFRNPDGLGDFEISQYYRPIPLTEEWLLKFGLIPNSDMSIWMLLSRPQWEDITIRCYDGIFTVWYGDSLMRDKRLEYVHQLQNLYFDLIEEELNINYKKNLK